MATRKVRHLQSKIWYQSSTGRLALSVDKELDFTTKMNGSAHPKTAQVSGSPIPPPTFAHLMFLFNSTGWISYSKLLSRLDSKFKATLLYKQGKNASYELNIIGLEQRLKKVVAVVQ